MAWGTQESSDQSAISDLLALTDGTQELMNNPPEVDLPFGNTIVRTLDGELAYTRIGESENVNLSGVSETLLEDAIAITKDGVSIYEAFDNEALWSEDFSNPVWAFTGTSLTPSYGIAPNGLNDSTRVLFSSGDQALQQLVVALNNIEATLCIWVKGVLGETIRLGNVGAANFVLTGDWQRICGTGTSANIALSINTFGGATARDIEMWGASAVASNKATPYIKTTTTAATRGADIASFQIMNNMPAPGQPFTIACDCKVPDNGLDARLYQLAKLLGSRIRLIAVGSEIFPYMSDGVSQIQGASVSRDGLLHTYVFRFDGSQFQLFKDGVASSSAVSISTPYWNVSENVYIGASASGSDPLNSEIKNFKVWHYAVSADAILALGAAS